MKIALLFLICSFSEECLVAQGEQNNSVWIFNYTLPNRNKAILFRQIDSSSIAVVAEYLRKDTLRGANPLKPLVESEILILRKSEKLELDSQIYAARHHSWTKQQLEEYGIYHLQIVDEGISKIDFQLNKYVYEIMQPIFLRHQTLCITYYFIACRGRCGAGEITIHRKVGQIWKPWILLARFES